MFQNDIKQLFDVPNIEEYVGNEIKIGVAAIHDIKDLIQGSDQVKQVEITTEREGLIGNELVCGRVKTGKTSAMLYTYKSLFEINNFATWIMATEGSELRILNSLPKKVIVLHPKIFKYNPLTPIGNNLEKNVDICFNAMSSAWLGVASRGFITPILKSLFSEIMNGRPKSLKDLIQLVRSSKYSDAKEKVLSRLQIFDSPFFNTEKPIDMELLANNHVIFLVESLESQVITYFFNDLIAKLMLWKRTKGEHGKNPENQHLHAVFMDECQKYLPSSMLHLHRDDLANIPSFQSAQDTRKLGIIMIWATQQPSLIHDAFLANCSNLLLGPLSNESDLRIVSKACGLTPEQLDYYRKMPQRNFLFYKDGKTFPVTIGNVEFGDRIPDENEIEEWNEEVLKSKPELAKLFRDEKAQSQKITVQNDDHFKFIEAINNYPCYPTTYYYKLLKQHFQQQKANQIKKTLEEKGFIKCHTIPTGMRYHSGIEITESGYEHFQLKRNLVYSKGADFPHTYIAENVCRYFGRGCEVVEREKKLGEHYADLFFKDTAIEIAVGNKCEYEKQNIMADLQHVGKVVVVGNDREHLEKIKKSVSDERVDYKLFCDFKG